MAKKLSGAWGRTAHSVAGEEGAHRLWDEPGEGPSWGCPKNGPKALQFLTPGA